jgi:general secretion pathway protein H
MSLSSLNLLVYEKIQRGFSHARLLRDRRAGFTLIEMIVVLVILGLMLGLVLAKGPLHSRTLTTRAAVGAMTSGLREARARAIATNRPVEFAVDIEHKSFHIDNAPPTRLPPDFGLTLTTTTGEHRSEAEGAILFEPDGSSSGGRIEVATGRKHIKIGIDWLSGRVSVADEK